MKKKLTLILACLFLSVGMALAQTTVSGTVVGSTDGQPVIGASVKVVGTRLGAMTNIDGNFSVSVPSSAKELQVSYLGMHTKTVRIAKNMRIVLQPNDKILDELIVVGYGTTHREAKTGSIATVSSKELASIPATSFDKMLAGKLAGVQITQSSGQPGSISNIRIRGISSINAGNEPLYVVDGVAIQSNDDADMTNTDNPLAMINPNDIESLTVLKDAAAASVYGSRAANGVILITTKSGKEGKSHITARAKFGFSQMANDNNFGVMTAQELLGYQRQAIINAGKNPDNPTNSANYYRPYSLLTGPLTNWMDEVSRTGKMQEYELSLNGGGAKTKYYSSLSYLNNEGIYYGIDFKRIQARVNADHEINQYLKTGARVNAGYTYGEDVPMQGLYYTNPAFAGLTIEPWILAYNEDGTFNTNIPENSNQNPRATAAYDDQWQKKYSFMGSMYLEWSPIKQLTFKTTDAIEMNFVNGRRYWSLEAHDNESGYPVLQTTETQRQTLTTSNTATYQDMFGKHSLRVLLGQEAFKYVYTQNYQSSKGLNPQIPYHVAGNSTNDLAYDESTETMLSYFGIADWNYDSRYYLQASIRTDGSSLFGSNNQWGTFWSLGGSWNMHNEKFMQDLSWLDILKLRASYGVNGNNNINAYQQYGTYTSSVYNGVTGMRTSTPSNPDLSWEKNYAWNFGVDFRFLKRFSGSFDFYTRETKDMLLDKAQSSTSGFNTALTNVGSMRNTGVEFQFDASIIDNKDWKWNVGFNISHNKSKILELAGDDMISYTTPSGDTEGRLKHIVGEKLYTFYLADYYGVNPVNGEALWRTEDGSLTNDFSKARYVKAGSPEPTYTGGINTTLSWKDFTLSVVTEFKGGNKVLLAEDRYLKSDGNQLTMNQAKSLLNYWKKPGDTGCNPKPIAGNATSSYSAWSTRFLQNGGFFRIKDVTLSYNVPTQLLNKIGMSAAKVYMSGLNVYTIHNVDFWDPERGVDGMGYGIYPVSKTFVIGVDLTL